MPPSARLFPTSSWSLRFAPGVRQITFSQIDKSVLGALPPELRQEVICQVEARKRQRQAGGSNSYASFPSTSQGNPSSARLGGRHEHASTAAFDSGGCDGGDGGGSSSAIGVSVQHASCDSGSEGRVGAGAGGVRATEAVRDGFDLVAREGSAKVQQVRDCYGTVFGPSCLARCRHDVKSPDRDSAP